MGDEHQRSNSSLPMFSPLKESDLFQSKKITPRTYMQNNYLLNQSKLLQSQYGNKESQQDSLGSMKQSNSFIQATKLHNAIQNLQPFDLKSPSHNLSMQQLISHSNNEPYLIIDSNVKSQNENKLKHQGLCNQDYIHSKQEPDFKLKLDMNLNKQ